MRFELPYLRGRIRISGTGIKRQILTYCGSGDEMHLAVPIISLTSDNSGMDARVAGPLESQCLSWSSAMDNLLGRIVEDRACHK